MVESKIIVQTNLAEVEQDTLKVAEAVVQLDKEIADLAATQKKAQLQQDAQVNSLKGYKASLELLTDEYNNLDLSTKAGIKRQQELASEMNTLNNNINRAEKATGKYNASVDTMREGIKGSINNMSVFGVSIGQVSTMLNAAKGAIMAMSSATKILNMVMMASPLGLVAGLLVALQTYMTQTQEGVDKTAQVFAKFGQVIKPLTDLLAGLGKILFGVIEGIADGLSYVSGTKEAANNAAKVVKNAQQLELINKKLETQAEAQVALQEETKNIRDNEMVGLTQRIEANNKLLTQIEAEAKARRDAQTAVIKQIEDEIQQLDGKVGVTEKLKQLEEARKELQSIESDRQGKLNEQITNRVSLQKELNQLQSDNLGLLAELQLKQGGVSGSASQVQLQMGQAAMTYQQRQSDLLRESIMPIAKESIENVSNSLSNMMQKSAIISDMITREANLGNVFGTNIQVLQKDLENLTADINTNMEVLEQRRKAFRELNFERVLGTDVYNNLVQKILKDNADQAYNNYLEYANRVQDIKNEADALEVRREVARRDLVIGNLQTQLETDVNILKNQQAYYDLQMRIFVLERQKAEYILSKTQGLSDEERLQKEAEIRNTFAKNEAKFTEQQGRQRLEAQQDFIIESNKQVLRDFELGKALLEDKFKAEEKIIKAEYAKRKIGLDAVYDADRKQLELINQEEQDALELLGARRIDFIVQQQLTENQLRLQGVKTYHQAYLEEVIKVLESERKLRLKSAKSKEEIALIEQEFNKKIFEAEANDAFLKEQFIIDVVGMSAQAISQIYVDKAEDIALIDKALTNALLDSQMTQLQGASQVAQGLAQIAGEQTAIGKSLAITAITLDTIAQSTKVFAQAAVYAANPLTAPLAANAYIQGGLIVGKGAASVASILAVKQADVQGANAFVQGITTMQGGFNTMGGQTRKVNAIKLKRKELKLASGGLVQGSGTGTSDSIPAMLSNGESVINSNSTRVFRPILSAINQAGGGAPIGTDVVGRAATKKVVKSYEEGQMIIEAVKNLPPNELVLREFKNMNTKVTIKEKRNKL